MMVALRGPLRRHRSSTTTDCHGNIVADILVEDVKNQAGNKEININDKNEKEQTEGNNREEEEYIWTWNGLWTFGPISDLPHDGVLPPSIKHRRRPRSMGTHPYQDDQHYHQQQSQKHIPSSSLSSPDPSHTPSSQVGPGRRRKSWMVKEKSLPKKTTSSSISRRPFSYRFYGCVDASELDVPQNAEDGGRTTTSVTDRRRDSVCTNTVIPGTNDVDIEQAKIGGQGEESRIGEGSEDRVVAIIKDTVNNSISEKLPNNDDDKDYSKNQNDEIITSISSCNSKDESGTNDCCSRLASVTKSISGKKLEKKEDISGHQIAPPFRHEQHKGEKEKGDQLIGKDEYEINKKDIERGKENELIQEHQKENGQRIEKEKKKEMNLEKESVAKREKIKVSIPRVNTSINASSREQFTDAGSTKEFMGKCPMGGCWKGHFENLSSAKKGKVPTLVSETFYLFFSSTPPLQTHINFATLGQGKKVDQTDDVSEIIEQKCNVGDITETKATKQIDTITDIDDSIDIVEGDYSSGYLPIGDLRVRGMGTNEYGKFKIWGGYNVKTCVLSCQRVYDPSNEGNVSSSASASSSRELMNTRARKLSLSSTTVGLPSRMVTRDRSQRSRRPSWHEVLPGEADYNASVSPLIKKNNLTRKKQPSWKKSQRDNSIGNEERRKYSTIGKKRRRDEMTVIKRLSPTMRKENTLHHEGGQVEVAVSFVGTNNGTLVNNNAGACSGVDDDSTPRIGVDSNGGTSSHTSPNVDIGASISTIARDKVRQGNMKNTERGNMTAANTSTKESVGFSGDGTTSLDVCDVDGGVITTGVSDGSDVCVLVNAGANVNASSSSCVDISVDIDVNVDVTIGACTNTDSDTDSDTDVDTDVGVYASASANAGAGVGPGADADTSADTGGTTTVYAHTSIDASADVGVGIGVGLDAGAVVGLAISAGIGAVTSTGIDSSINTGTGTGVDDDNGGDGDANAVDSSNSPGSNILPGPNPLKGGTVIKSKGHFPSLEPPCRSDNSILTNSQKSILSSRPVSSASPIPIESNPGVTTVPRKAKSPTHHPANTEESSFSTPPPSPPAVKKSKGASNKKTSSLLMTIPPAGNPLEAHWRAAHFMYYMKSSEPVVSSLNTTTVTTSDELLLSNLDTPNDHAQLVTEPALAVTTTSFVVYEGEMNHGHNKRDGRGVCLYNNGNIYEGEWKKNMEHGYGMLVTSDRTTTIYKGEWERGKMHGNGTYYYHRNNNSNEMDCESIQEKGEMYTGDFKENARHGTGKYELEDGSSYDGEWRDNVPCGRGIFRWLNGSIYDGHWKNGKRHGSGVLRTTDNFSYDGMWIKNSMEGRASAIYPNGQRYEGMFHCGKRDGRGTMRFQNGAVYEGRFREDRMEGQGTLKMGENAVMPRTSHENGKKEENVGDQQNSCSTKNDDESNRSDWMIPIAFQSDIGHIHQKAGFTTRGN